MERFTPCTGPIGCHIPLYTGLGNRIEVERNAPAIEAAAIASYDGGSTVLHLGNHHIEPTLLVETVMLQPQPCGSRNVVQIACIVVSLQLEFPKR